MPLISVTLDLAYQTLGSGPALLVLHGLFGSSANWRSIARQLAATRTVYCVDMRNHGASPWASSMSYVEMADDVLQLMDRLDLQRAAVLGHSMGGKAAMALALRYPQRLEQLVVVDIAPVSYVDVLSPVAQAMLSVNLPQASGRSDVERRLAQLLPDVSIVPFLMQNLVTRNEHFDWRLNLAAIYASMPNLCGFPDELKSLRSTCPLAVIAGELSPYVAQRDGSSFRPMFSQVSVDVIANAGHWVHADQPAAFISRLKQVLRASD